MAELASGRALETGFRELVRLDRDFAGLLERYGQPHVRSRPEGFESLLHIIMQQQLSLASAAAIWSRLAVGLGRVSPQRVLQAAEQELRGYGLSRPKIRYARALAEAVDGGALDLAALAALDDEAAVEALTAVPGIGRWTAEIYLLTALQRADVWPAADVALMIAAQEVKALPARPGVGDMYALAEPWRPWRTFAARLLWHYYRHAKGRAVPA